jgi:hypothetical protein
MENLHKKELLKSNEVSKLEKGKLEIANLGEVVNGRAIVEPGWSWMNVLN